MNINNKNTILQIILWIYKFKVYVVRNKIFPFLCKNIFFLVCHCRCNCEFLFHINEFQSFFFVLCDFFRAYVYNKHLRAYVYSILYTKTKMSLLFIKMLLNKKQVYYTVDILRTYVY